MLVRIQIPYRLLDSRVVRRIGRALGGANPRSGVASCPDCGTVSLRRIKKADRTARTSCTLWTAIHRFFGGRWYLCDYCRLQFFDCRPQSNSDWLTYEASAK